MATKPCKVCRDIESETNWIYLKDDNPKHGDWCTRCHYRYLKLKEEVHALIGDKLDRRIRTVFQRMMKVQGPPSGKRRQRRKPDDQ